MAQLSLSRAWEETTTILVRERGLLAAVGLALIALPDVILWVVGLPMEAKNAVAQMVYVVAVLLSLAAQIAVNRLAIGPSVTVKEAIAQGFIRLISVFAVLIVLMIALVIIAIILAIPLSAAGIMTLPGANQPPTPSLVIFVVILIALGYAIFQLVFPLAAVETGNPIRLASRSWQLGRRQYPRLLAYVVMFLLGFAIITLAGQFGGGSVVLLLLGQPNPGSLAALALGLILGIVQAAFTVTTAVMLARIYVQLAGRDLGAAGVPRSGT